MRSIHPRFAISIQVRSRAGSRLIAAGLAGCVERARYGAIAPAFTEREGGGVGVGWVGALVAMISARPHQRIRLPRPFQHRRPFCLGMRAGARMFAWVTLPLPLPPFSPAPTSRPSSLSRTDQHARAFPRLVASLAVTGRRRRRRGRGQAVLAVGHLNDLIGDKPLFMPLYKYFHKYGGVYKLSFAPVAQATFYVLSDPAAVPPPSAVPPSPTPASSRRRPRLRPSRPSSPLFLSVSLSWSRSPCPLAGSEKREAATKRKLWRSI